MKEQIQISELQYLIKETGIVGDYVIQEVDSETYDRGASHHTTWETEEAGSVVIFSSEVIRNDNDAPRTKKVLKFQYKTAYQIHHQLIDLNDNKSDRLLWNLSELFFRHKCIIQQLFIECDEFVDNGFQHSTDSFYYTFQEVKARLSHLQKS